MRFSTQKIFCFFLSFFSHKLDQVHYTYKMKPMMKTKWILPLLILPSFFLSSCGNASTPEKVILDFGSGIVESQEIELDSHLTRISYEKLKQKIEAKENFIALVHPYNEVPCSCWIRFHDKVFAPYVASRRLMVYSIDYDELLEQEEHYGLELHPGHETIGIYKEGGLMYQHDDVDEKSDFVLRYEAFAEWMDARIERPRVLLIDKDTLDDKYEDEEPFSIYFSRSGCGDCRYLTSHSFRQYFSSNHIDKPLIDNCIYALDCDVVGIAKVLNEDGKEIGYSSSSSASEDQKRAYAQWLSFKEEYGLSYSEDNPAGWDNGYVPTLFHIQPDGVSKKGDVIDGAGVFYNDKIDEENLLISSSYFTNSRLEIDALTYLKDSQVENKILQNLKIEAVSADIHETLAPFMEPIFVSFLDSFIG